MGKASRDKGKRGELQAREPLRELTGIEWERSAAQARGGEGVADLRPVGRLSVLHPEVKVGAAPPVLPGLEQAERDCVEGEIPVCLAKRDRGQWALVVRVADFWALVEACGGRRRPW